jgi:hypothetical protein
LIKKLKPSLFSSQNNSSFDILASLELPLYLTTNYDTLIEDAIVNRGKKPDRDFCKWNEKLATLVKVRPIPSVFDNEQYKPTKEKPLVYHINGDITLPGSMVLTERDYFEFVAYMNRNEDKDILPPNLRTGINQGSLLFIGYTPEDINFRAIFQGFLSFMRTISMELRAPSFAVQNSPDISNKKQVKLQRYLERYTLHMFEMRVYWGSTQDFLIELQKRWNEFRGKTGRYTPKNEGV